VLGGGRGELAHAEVVDDEQRRRGQALEMLVAPAFHGGLGELREKDVGLSVEHAMSLLDRGAPDRLGEMALAGARRTEKKRVLAQLDEAAGRELEDQLPVHLAVEGEVEGVERPVWIAEASLLDAPLDEGV